MTVLLQAPARAEPVDEIGQGEPFLEQSRPHRFTLEEYLRLSELGFFGGRRTEFIDGEILDMPAQKDSHAYGVTTASRWCGKAFNDARFWVRVQMTLRTGDSSPEPDLAVLDYPATSSASYATSDRAALVIEVSDASLLADTTTKMSLYASAGVRDYWVLSIPDQLLIVHRQPIRSAASRHGWAYAEVRRLVAGEAVSPLAMPGAAVDPGSLLP
jgi:Uma2 family endonuclease